MAATSWSRLCVNQFPALVHVSKCRICYRPVSSGTARLTSNEIRRKRSAMFDQERARQQGLVRRLEKIRVELQGPPESCTLIMNKHLSTPWHCAMHTEEEVLRRAALALVDGEPWDMHRPLVGDCSLQLLTFQDEDPRLLNQVFLRSCSVMLGEVLERAFNSRCSLALVSFPPPSVRSGSFVYDVDLKLPHADSRLGQFELRALSRMGAALQAAALPFQRLEVDAAVAAAMFEDNAYKSAQIPAIAARSATGSSVTLYRLGTHVDLSRGPLLSSTHHVARFSVTAAHSVSSRDCGRLTRFQGLALPAPLKLHYWTYDLLTQRARRLNPAPLPTLPAERPEAADSTAVHSDV